LPHEISFGRGIALTLSWEAEPPLEVGPSYRTASGAFNVRLEPIGGSIEGTREVAVDAETLDDFDSALARLLDGLTGTVTLEPTSGLDGYGSFAITITLDKGKGNVHGFLAAQHPEARLSFAGYETDQSYLQETQRQLRALLADRWPLVPLGRHSRTLAQASSVTLAA
jgi:hypothetical protein